MNNVEAKLTRDFKDWRAENKKNETNKEAISLDAEEFMLEMFQIQPVDSPTEQQITILDILDMMIASNVDASIAVQSVRDDALACKKSAQIEEDCSDFTYTCSNPEFTLLGDKCFYVSEAKAKHWDAQTECEDIGAKMAHIRNPDEDELVFELMKNKSEIEQTWVGLKKKKGVFLWRFYAPVAYDNWLKLPRQHPNGDGDCVAKAGDIENEGKWFDAPCFEEKRYACSSPAEKFCHDDVARSALKNIMTGKACVQSEKNDTDKDFKPTLPGIDLFLNPARKEEMEKIIKTKKMIAKSYFEKTDMRALYPKLFQILWESTLPCFKEENEKEYMLLSCELAGVNVDCSDIFTRVPTDSGMCCALNVEDSLRASKYQKLVKALQATKKTRTLKSQEGLRNGLKLTLDLHSNTMSFGTVDQQYKAFKLFLGQPAQFPTMRDKSLQVQAGREHFIDLSAKVVSTNDIREISPEARGCLFNDESHLDFYKSYTFSNCRLECMIREAEKINNCIPWQLPRVGKNKSGEISFLFREKTPPHAILGQRGTLMKRCKSKLRDAHIAFQTVNMSLTAL